MRVRGEKARGREKDRGKEEGRQDHVAVTQENSLYVSGFPGTSPESSGI